MRVHVILGLDVPDRRIYKFCAFFIETWLGLRMFLPKVVPLLIIANPGLVDPNLFQLNIVQSVYSMTGVLVLTFPKEEFRVAICYHQEVVLS